MIPALLALAVGPAWAGGGSEPEAVFSGLNTPFTVGRGHGVVGLFRPATVGVSERTEVQVNGLALFLGPQLEAKSTFHQAGGFALAVSGELAVPRPAAGQLQQGFLQVIAGDQDLRWMLVPGASLLAGWRSDRWVVSTRLRLRGGLPLSSADRPLQFQDLSWLDPWLAPQVAGGSTQLFGRVDWLPRPAWNLSAQGRVELVGGPDFSGRLLALGAWGDHLAGGIGWAAALSRHRDGYPDLNRETPKSAPVFLVDALPVFDLQGRW